MALNDRDRRVLAEIARQVRVNDPEFAAALTGPLRRPQPVWAPIGLRVLGFLLIAIGVMASVPPLVLAAFVAFGIAQLSWISSPPRSTAGGTTCRRRPTAREPRNRSLPELPNMGARPDTSVSSAPLDGLEVDGRRRPTGPGRSQGPGVDGQQRSGGRGAAAGLSADHPGPSPEVNMSQSPHEQRILVGIEDPLSRNDPALVGLFSRHAFARHPALAAGRTYVRSLALLGLLVVVLVALMLASPLATLGRSAAVGLLTAVLVVPWIVAATQAFAHERTPQPGHGPSGPADIVARFALRAGHRRTTSLTRTRPSSPPTGLPIGLTVGALVMALVAGAMEIALCVIAVVLLVAAGVLRWHARRALFRHCRYPGPDRP